MKRPALVLLAVVAVVAIALPFQSVVGQNSASEVTAAASVILPSGAQLAGVRISGLNFGAGVFLSGDGSASGEVEVTLSGKSASGQAQTITVEGAASKGSLNTDGSVTLSGASAVDLGDGTPPLTSVPFTATVTAGTLVLKVGTQALPLGTVAEGSITIQ